MLKAPDKSIKDETASRVNTLSVVPVSVASCSFHPNPNLSNIKPGYSFVSDPRNHTFYNQKSFLTLVMDSPRLQDEFVIAIAEDGTPLMNLGRVRKWLNDYADGLLFLMAAIEVLVGSLSRGTELTYIQLRNTSCRTWGLYNIGRRMAIVV